VAPPVLALTRPARQLLYELGRLERVERLLDVLDRPVGIEPLDPLLELARRLGAAEHEHGEQRDLRRDAAERVVEQMAELGGTATRPAREPHPAAPGEAVERRPDLRHVVVDDGIAVRRLVAGVPECVQGERVLIGRRALLLDQAAEHPDLNCVRVHANNRSAARSAHGIASRPAWPGAPPAPVLDRLAGGADAATPGKPEEHRDVEGEHDDPVAHPTSFTLIVPDPAA
jgi:hypothetical protein